MCNRHVAHLIADYEAARRGGDEESDGEGENRSASNDSDDASTDRDGVLASVVARFGG